MFRTQAFVDFDEFKRDLAAVNQNVFVMQKRLVGGELFLNPDLSQNIEYVRNLMPQTDIHMIINGLLIPKISNRIFDSLVKNKIMVDISPHKSTNLIEDKIEKCFSQYGVQYQWTRTGNAIESFLKNNYKYAS